jgi:CRP/FNR family cyclic AMP-dependent transcriptional regulator
VEVTERDGGTSNLLPTGLTSFDEPMIERFYGPDGERVITDALLRQSAIQGDRELAVKLARAVSVQEIKTGSLLIQQDATDNDLYFIFVGKFSISVNGRDVAHRSAEQYVGEMALIDPKAKRSATVTALEDSVVAKISEAQFTRLANQNANLWRNLACVLADRLRQRADFVRQPNDVPQLFIGSSKECLSLANEIESGLSRERIVVTVWSKGVFSASDFSMESLARVVDSTDFAVLILGADDTVICRKKETAAPRDNVVFELGLFMGAIGRQRTFLLVPRSIDIKIPTDLLGITPLYYEEGDPNTLAKRIEPVCAELRKVISARGPR